MRRRSWRFVASGISASWPDGLHVRAPLGRGEEVEHPLGLLAVFGSPNACIFFIADASSGFCRSSAAIDIRWNQRLNSGTFERKVTIGPQVAPAADPPEQHEDAEQHGDDKQHEQRDPGPDRHGAIVPESSARGR